MMAYKITCRGPNYSSIIDRSIVKVEAFAGALNSHLHVGLGLVPADQIPTLEATESREVSLFFAHLTVSALRTSIARNEKMNPT